jgi:hypothetical protein
MCAASLSKTNIYTVEKLIRGAFELQKRISAFATPKLRGLYNEINFSINYANNSTVSKDRKDSDH